MSEFKREERYLVFKLKDMSPGSAQFLREWAVARQLPDRQYVLIESDWPEYETVWRMIETRVSGQPSDYDRLEAENKALKADKRLIIAERDKTFDLMLARAERAEQELEALRSRVVVVPERKSHPHVSSALTSKGIDSWNACLDELERLNGKTVSEGLLRRLVNHLERDGNGEVSAYDYCQRADRLADELRALLDDKKPD